MPNRLHTLLHNPTKENVAWYLSATYPKGIPAIEVVRKELLTLLRAEGERLKKIKDSEPLNESAKQMILLYLHGIQFLEIRLDCHYDEFLEEVLKVSGEKRRCFNPKRIFVPTDKR